MLPNWVMHKKNGLHKVQHGIIIKNILILVLKVDGETTINEKQCKILSEKFYDTNNEEQSLGSYFLYADQSKVYLYQDNEFRLLYDFGANKGDTIYITAYSEFCQCDSTLLVIDSISETVIDGNSYKTLYHHSLSNCSLGNKSIEFIGGLDYFFPFNQAADPVPGDLRCYYDDMFSFNNNWAFSCDTLFTNINITPNNKIDFKYYPNLIRDKLNISFSGNCEHTIEIRTIDAVLKYKSIFVGNKLSVNALEWQQGIYILIIDNKYSAKIIKI